MTSGIYKLTFSSGRAYIGKSINIETRWKQHYDKFRKGTAAKNMQAEYDACGAPETKIIFVCHTDHIDLVEASFINRLKPELNGTYPVDPFVDIYDDEYAELMGMLHLPTVVHLSLLAEMNATLDASLLDTALLNEEVNSLVLTRSNQELEFDVNNRIKEYASLVKEQTSDIEKLTQENDLLTQKLAQPWWKKVFN